MRIIRLSAWAFAVSILILWALPASPPTDAEILGQGEAYLTNDEPIRKTGFKGCYQHTNETFIFPNRISCINPDEPTPFSLKAISYLKSFLKLYLGLFVVGFVLYIPIQIILAIDDSITYAKKAKNNTSNSRKTG